MSNSTVGNTPAILKNFIENGRPINSQILSQDNATVQQPYWVYPEDDNQPSFFPLVNNMAKYFRAWFLPPVSGNYIFYIACDDVAQVWLSSSAGSGNTSDLGNILNQYSWTHYGDYIDYWYNTNRTISTPVNLTAGELYLFEVYWV